MRELAANWYVFLSSLNASLALPLRALGDGLGIPMLSALLFGLIGATAPCQLTTNAGALAYVARQAGGTGGRQAAARSTLAFVLGKVLVYTVVGAAVLLAGRQLVSIPFIVAVRRLLGPAMLIM